MLRNLRSCQLARPTRESVRLQNCRWQRPHHSNVTITITSRRRCWRTIQNSWVPNCWCRRTIPFSYKSAVLLRNIFHRQCDAYFIASEFLMKGPVTGSSFSDPLSLSNDVTKLHSDSSIDLLLSLCDIGLHLEIALNKIWHYGVFTERNFWFERAIEILFGRFHYPSCGRKCDTPWKQLFTLHQSVENCRQKRKSRWPNPNRHTRRTRTVWWTSLERWPSSATVHKRWSVSVKIQFPISRHYHQH